MLRGSEIAVGACLLIDGRPRIAVEREAGAGAFRIRFRDLGTGSLAWRDFKASERVEEAGIELLDCEFQYSDDRSFVFASGAGLDLVEVPVAGQEEKAPFLKEGGTYAVVLWEGRPLDIRIPPKIVLAVVEFESYLRGDSLFSATKPARTETGLVVRVPLDIERGERILVDTATRSFVERAP